MNNFYIFFPFFIVMWCGICLLLAYGSGWRELAQHYRYQNEPIVRKKYCQWADMKGVNYKSCLIMGGNAQGFYLAVLFIFSLGSPRLFIPWHDIKFSRKTFWGFPALELRFIKAPTITLTVSEAMANFFQEVSGGTLVIEEDRSLKGPGVNDMQWLNIILAGLGFCVAMYFAFFVSHK